MTKEINGPVVYIGPNVPAKGLKTYRIYANGVPKEFSGIFRNLFVTPDRLMLARREAVKGGTIINKAYKKIMQQDWSEN